MMRRAMFAAAVVGLMACAPQSGAAPDVGMERVTIETAGGPVHFAVEIADDDAERARGLMFRDSLGLDRGMLFDFPDPEMASFWMRNTRISLDIMFIGVDGRILNIAERTTPYSEESIPAVGLTRAVLEVNAGRAEALGIRPGDRVRHRILDPR